MFNEFLSKIDLEKNRQKYKSIKCLEADMDKNIQALDCIYKIYWEEPVIPIPDFDTFYNKYYLTEETKQNVIKFNNSKIGLCNDCLFKGLEARIYRTWASLITQIQGAYCCREVFGDDNVMQSTELDHNGVDIFIKYKTKKIGIQVKKKTERREIANRKPEKKELKFVDEMRDIYYFALKDEDIKNPQYIKDGKNFKKGDWKPYAILFGLDNKTEPVLKLLKNGFTVFTNKYFTDLKDEVAKSE